MRDFHMMDDSLFGEPPNPLEMARRLSRPRSLLQNDIYQHQNEVSQRTKRRESESKFLLTKAQRSTPVLPHRRKSETTIVVKNLGSNGLASKIRRWLQSTESLIDRNDSDSLCSSKSGDSASVFESEVLKKETNRKVSNDSMLPINLQEEAKRLGYSTEPVKWCLSNCNLLLCVQTKLFPIDTNFVSYVSNFFQVFINTNFSNRESQPLHLEMEGYDADIVETALKFIYSVNEGDVNDENVASLLLLSQEFKMARLRVQCEQYLLESKTFNVLIAIQLASQYKLTNLLNEKCKEISKERGIENTKEFDNLETEIQNKILKLIVQRYANASKTLSQFDTHLCSYHCNCYKSDSEEGETCCYRAATYNTVDERRFLVKIESPSSKLQAQFDEAFNETI